MFLRLPGDSLSPTPPILSILCIHVSAGPHPGSLPGGEGAGVEVRRFRQRRARMAVTGQLTICQLELGMGNGADCLGSPDPVQRVRGQFIPALSYFPQGFTTLIPQPAKSATFLMATGTPRERAIAAI